jgi:isopentenyl-diphosphate delta-isomerase type 1
MSEEIFDVVDANDQVIGQQPRSEVHRLGLRHRAIHLLVFNAKGELFLQKRSMKKDCFPGTWDSSVSGHVDAGEEYGACALRETREEIGLELAAVPERLFKIDACEATGQEFVWVYRCEHEGPFQLDPEELSDGGWFAPKKITNWIAVAPEEFAPAFVLIWQLLRDK